MAYDRSSRIVFHQNLVIEFFSKFTKISFNFWWWTLLHMYSFPLHAVIRFENSVILYQNLREHDSFFIDLIKIVFSLLCFTVHINLHLFKLPNELLFLFIENIYELFSFLLRWFFSLFNYLFEFITFSVSLYFLIF